VERSDLRGYSNLRPHTSSRSPRAETPALPECRREPSAQSGTRLIISVFSPSFRPNRTRVCSREPCAKFLNPSHPAHASHLYRREAEPMRRRVLRATIAPHTAYGTTFPRHPLWPSPTPPQTRLRCARHCLNGARHRREHVHLQPPRYRPLPPAPGA
jgi:hypothetical protein